MCIISSYKEGRNMPLANKKYYTINDIYELPEGKRAELIEGDIFYMAAPSRKHQDIVSFFTKAIGNYIDKKEGNCRVYPAPFAVFLKTEEDDTEYNNYVEPDVSVICTPDRLNDKGCSGAPDWIIEIVSPASRKMDYYLKLTLYQMNGVREYWIVDPDRKIVIVYDFEHMNPAALYRLTDTIKVGIYDSLEIDLNSIRLD